MRLNTVSALLVVWRTPSNSSLYLSIVSHSAEDKRNDAPVFRHIGVRPFIAPS
jgi:hypothetical protein